MTVSKINKLQQIVLAVENISLLSSFSSKLKLSVGSDDLVGINFEELLSGLQRLEDEQQIIKLSNQNNSVGEIFFYLTNPHGLDFWAKEIREGKDHISGEIKNRGNLKISMERAWLKFNSEKINVNLSNKYIKFLIDLIDAKGAIIPYYVLVTKLDLSSSSQTNKKQSAPNDLKSFKQDLQNYLMQCGISRDSAIAIKNMINSVRNTGYQLL